MAIVDQIQDKNNVTRDIVDKGLNSKTSQSAVASSDYVLLEDTGGAYHKIAKASFVEAVRGAMGDVINSVAKGTDIAKLPVLDSNNDLGMGTLANVASVLGVLKIQGGTSSPQDANTLENGVCMIYAGTTAINYPTNGWYGTVLTVRGGNGSLTTAFGFQIAITQTGGAMYFRGKDNGGINNWSSWHSVSYS